MILTTKTIILGITAGSIGLISGIKYYDHLKKEREYKKLYDSFIEYDTNRKVTFYDLDNKDTYDSFRVIHFESIEDFVAEELP